MYVEIVPLLMQVRNNSRHVRSVQHTEHTLPSYYFFVTAAHDLYNLYSYSNYFLTIFVNKPTVSDHPSTYFKNEGESDFY